MKTQLSVIVPVYNTERFLRRCIESILNQNVEKCELILINDGSTDSSGKICDEYAKESGATIEITDDLDGVKGADVIYTDVWISMGEEKKEQERERLGKPYQVNAALMERTGKDTTIFSHCLPAIKEKEVTEEVFEGPQSRVFDEAENRLHTIKAVMVATLGENE